MQNNEIIVSLIGNPNVGKSTLFNALTNMRQHTGNWTGKTVELAFGNKNYKDYNFTFVDLPGTYSFATHSKEEQVTKDFLYEENQNCTIIVVDSTCIERNLNLVLQTLEITKNCVICLNLIDEAKKKGITIDIDKMQSMLGVPVIPCIARSKYGLDALLDSIIDIFNNPKSEKNIAQQYDDNSAYLIIEKAEQIASECVIVPQNATIKDRKIDRILTSKAFGIPLMLLCLISVLFITITGANYPSAMLAEFLFSLNPILTSILASINTPIWLQSMLVDGLYTTLSWVVSVMLPPMAIFFPLFTLLEDVGYLPRVAFNLDHCFKKACTCGKQSLTMCMGLGCNAAGVVGCRIIDSPRERLIAILTNCLMPCNGRFPTLIALISMFCIGSLTGIFSWLTATLCLTFIIICGVLATFLMSKLLSKTLLKGMPSSFTLELPPYRKPQIGKVIIRSIFDRTILILGRAVMVAAPAGIIIWVLANITINDIALIKYASDFLDPFASVIGLDGVILLAFILGFPANEIVLPIALMCYLSTGTLIEMNDLQSMWQLLVANGWTITTAICTMFFSLFHFPCSTTCLTIKKETKSIKWTLVSMILPTSLGICVCFVINLISKIVLNFGF